jgi:hypothetical protein
MSLDVFSQLAAFLEGFTALVADVFSKMRLCLSLMHPDLVL